MREDIALGKIGRLQFRFCRIDLKGEIIVDRITSGSSTYIDTIFTDNFEDMPAMAVNYAEENNERGEFQVKLKGKWLK